MASPLSALDDALVNINIFSPKKQAKIKLWYPKLEAAQRKARTALADMMHVLNAPPISVRTPAYKLWTEKRKSYEVAYAEAWKQYQEIINEYENISKLSVKARRSSRLATKPRINYKEDSSDEE